MARQPNRFGGGARTNAHGLYFEQTTSLDSALEEAGYEVRNHKVYKYGINIGMSVPQSRLYKYFLAPNGINYKDYNSKEWHPDEAFINYENRTVYIIEKKFQSKSGSVDEKLATFPFKIYEYQKLLDPIEYDIVYIYLLSSEWFDSPKYKDYYDYMNDLGCPYYFDRLPLEAIGIY